MSALVDKKTRDTCQGKVSDHAPRRVVAPKAMILATGLAALLASPAAAQDADPENQMIEALVVCAMAGNDPETALANLGLYGWTDTPDIEGTILAIPSEGDATHLAINEDGSHCMVESQVVGTDRTTELLALVLDGAGYTLPEPVADADGCPSYGLSADLVLTLTSAGSDPTCASDTTSAVRFKFGPAE